MAIVGADRQLTAHQRENIVASGFGSVRAEGLDPSSVEPDAQAWVRGEITVDELVQRQLDAVAAEHGQPAAHAA